MSRLYHDNSDDYVRPRRRSDERHRRDYSPDYYSGGGPQRVYASGAMPVPPTAPYPPTQTRIDHDHHHTPFYRNPPNAGNTNDRLPVPVQSPSRPRSTPPNHGAVTTHPHHYHHHHQNQRSRDSEPSPESRRERSPVSRTRNALNHTFTHTNSGIGAGVIGAIVGGLAAREASRASGSRQGHHGRKEEDKKVMLSTLVGATVGGLGANAVERRIESGREKTRVEQERWEKKWGKEKGSDARAIGRDERGKSRSPRSSDEGESDHVYERRRRRRSDDEVRYRS